MSNGAEAIYLDQIVELSVELLSFRTMVQILLGQQRDLQKQLENSQRARRELQAHSREWVRYDIRR